MKKFKSIKLLVILLFLMTGCSNSASHQFRTTPVSGFIENYEGTETLVQFPVVYMKTLQPKLGMISKVVLVGDDIELEGSNIGYQLHETNINKDYSSANLSFTITLPPEGDYVINKIVIELSDTNKYEQTDVDLKIKSIMRIGDTELLKLRSNTMSKSPDFDMSFTLENTSENIAIVKNFSFDNELFYNVDASIYNNTDRKFEQTEMNIPKNELRTFDLIFESKEDLSEKTILLLPTMVYEVEGN